jgi:hypothetical protein
MRALEHKPKINIMAQKSPLRLLMLLAKDRVKHSESVRQDFSCAFLQFRDMLLLSLFSISRRNALFKKK